jgi:hypothetical protein
MRPERGGSARRLACQIALGCLIGAATVAGMTLARAAPASADSCSSAIAAVEGGRTSSHYGVRADVYINTMGTVNAYLDGFVRSLFVWVNSNNWVEVGWSAHISGTGEPQVFAEWDNAGRQNHFDYKLIGAYDTDRNFRIENVGHIKIFRFYFAGESSPFTYSPTMNFNIGYPRGNSERHNWCQSLYAHFYNLNDQISDGTWENWDTWAKCINTTARNPYYMHKDSSSEFHVTSTSPNNMTCTSS